ncbi:MAG TPA: 3-methyl-2-oxobutanoate hydroxymethyltransferase [Gemmatimonadaceae bacterium]|nr:3-methyl-2-oxobutanoate hydroxymethyltransferase [Gemmatimonadaceae bacterium]
MREPTEARRARLDALLNGRVRDSTPIVMLTAYDFISASIAQAAGVDIILVGDSAANTVLGYATTREVSVDEMLVLTRAARRGAPDLVVVGDLPFGSYESDDASAIATAASFVDAGADIIKLEGAGTMLERVRAILDAGIPVMGHVGLLPQGAHSSKDLRARGRLAVEGIGIVEDAVALEQAGVALLVVEAVPAPVADAIKACVGVPVIGIGAGSRVDGQVLVYPDMLGLSPGSVPRFVRQYADLRSDWERAVRAYAADVRSRSFPSGAEEYGMIDAEREDFERRLAHYQAASQSS